MGGDSAGGTLAAVLCQDLRSSAETRPACQLLLYPGTDLSRKHPSFTQFNATGMGHSNRAAMLEACGALRMAIGAGTARR